MWNHWQVITAKENSWALTTILAQLVPGKMWAELWNALTSCEPHFTQILSHVSAVQNPGYSVLISFHHRSDPDLCMFSIHQSFCYKYHRWSLTEVTPLAAQSPPALNHFPSLMYVKQPVMVRDYKECMYCSLCVRGSFQRSEISLQLNIIYTQGHTFDPHARAHTYFIVS